MCDLCLNVLLSILDKRVFFSHLYIFSLHSLEIYLASTRIELLSTKHNANIVLLILLKHI